MIAGNGKKNTLKSRSRGAQSTSKKKACKGTVGTGQHKSHTKVGMIKS